MTRRNTLIAAIGATVLMMIATTTGVNAQPHPVQDCKPELIKATGAATNAAFRKGTGANWEGA